MTRLENFIKYSEIWEPEDYLDLRLTRALVKAPNTLQPYRLKGLLKLVGLPDTKDNLGEMFETVLRMHNRRFLRLDFQHTNGTVYSFEKTFSFDKKDPIMADLYPIIFETEEFQKSKPSCQNL